MASQVPAIALRSPDIVLSETKNLADVTYFAEGQIGATLGAECLDNVIDARDQLINLQNRKDAETASSILIDEGN